MAGNRSRKMGQGSSTAKKPAQSESSGRRLRESASEETLSTTEHNLIGLLKKGNTKKANQYKAKVAGSTKGKHVMSVAYIDEEADEFDEEADEINEDDFEDGDEDAFIDDGDECEHDNETENSDINEDNDNEEPQMEEQVDEEDMEEERVTPPLLVKNKGRVVQPSTPPETGAETMLPASPSTPRTSHRVRKPTFKRAYADNASDYEVVEVTPPPSPSKRRKGKTAVVVEHIDHKITVPGLGTATNVAVHKADDVNVEADKADDVNVEADKTSKKQPRKKDTTTAEKVKTTKASSSKGKAKLVDPILDTPTKGIARYMAASSIQADNKDGDDTVFQAIDAVSNPRNPNHVRFMGEDMVDTYLDRLAPPIIPEARSIYAAGECVDEPWTTFRAAMREVGIKRNTELYEALRNLTIQPTFGPYLYNIARVDMMKIVYTATTNGEYVNPRYTYSENLTGSGRYNANTFIAFVMFGTVVESHIINSVVRRNNKHQCFIRIKPLTMEFYRTVNILALLWDVGINEGLQVNKDGGGFTFATLPSEDPYGPRYASARGTSHPRTQGSAGSSPEPAIEFPDASIGGQPLYALSMQQLQEEIRKLAYRGKVFDNKIPVYNFIGGLTRDPPPMFNQEILTGATLWTGGEIEPGSYVCIHYSPSYWLRDGTKEVQWNLLRVVVLATPP